MYNKKRNKMAQNKNESKTIQTAQLRNLLTQNMSEGFSVYSSGSHSHDDGTQDALFKQNGRFSAINLLLKATGNYQNAPFSGNY